MSEFVARLSSWEMLDTWIAVTGALAAMACAVPGVFLVLRRQSLIGDALSHTVLLGIVGAYLANGWLQRMGVLAAGHGTPHAAMFLGAIIVGILSSVLTEAVQHAGRVESTAALGVVFTTLFALGLLLIRAVADSVHIDPDCVLYGMIEAVSLGEQGVPPATLINGGMLAVNLLLTAAFFKELRVTTFDPSLATTLGINARLVNYLLMAVTAATLTAAFESVGSILVIAMLIVPAATATLLSESLAGVLIIALVLASSGAVLGHALAITLPAMIFGPLGFPDVQDASTAGMMAFASGLLFVTAMIFAPRRGVLSQAWQQARLGLRIVREDVLGLLYRLDERQPGTACPRANLLRMLATGGPVFTRVALAMLRGRGDVSAGVEGLRLTEQGRSSARELVRAHRLWESYLARHFPLPGDHLHQPAERVEHYLDLSLQQELAEELQQPPTDPHGSTIPAVGRSKPVAENTDDSAHRSGLDSTSHGTT
jgi:manganese/zinc/iron transport system permease protein